MLVRRFAVGDWIIYRKLKHSASPGPRADNISSAPNGETYSYFVGKFWIVQEILSDGRLRLGTRTGKSHLVDPADPNLHRVAWWERWFYKSRFQEVEASLGLK